MPQPRILIIGGGGHALVVAEAARLAGLEVAGFFDDDAGASLAAQAPRLGGLSEWHAAGSGEAGLIMALGDLSHRARLFESAGRGRFFSVIHPRAVVSPAARVGQGVFIGPLAVVNPRAALGDHAIINSGAIIEHDCEIGENAHIAPGAALGGGAAVGRSTLIGLGSRVLPGVRIGAGCTVGAGAAVTRDVGDGDTVGGVPARRLR